MPQLFVYKFFDNLIAKIKTLKIFSQKNALKI